LWGWSFIMKLTENNKAILIGVFIAVVILIFLSFKNNDGVTGAAVADTDAKSVNQNNNEVLPIENTPPTQEPEIQKKELEIVGSDEKIQFGTKNLESRRFEWEYAGKQWFLTLGLSPEWYEYYKNKGKLLRGGERQRNYDIYVTDPDDDDLIKLISNQLTKLGTENGLQYEEIPSFVASFVQSLPYTKDDVTTGYDEYPRFPFETLYDDGGDCEDTSILVSAILKEMGYGVILVSPPGHMAVGVKCDGTFGTYYEYQGEKYCYLETTGDGFLIGEVPEEWKNAKATLISIYKRPSLDISFDGDFKSDSVNSYINENIKIKNLGSDWAENVKVYVALQTKDESKVWDQITSEEFDIKPEETFSYKVTNLHAPTGENFRIYVRAYGNNVISDEVVSDWVVWNK